MIRMLCHGFPNKNECCYYFERKKSGGKIILCHGFHAWFGVHGWFTFLASDYLTTLPRDTLNKPDVRHQSLLKKYETHNWHFCGRNMQHIINITQVLPHSQTLARHLPWYLAPLEKSPKTRSLGKSPRSVTNHPTPYIQDSVGCGHQTFWI